ncbi:hypothetical protein VTG60DRAFT_7060 [Thermothelomyces hinnuleus]
MHRPGGICHLHLRRVCSPKLLYRLSKSWAAPHDTSLISIDVTHQRNGQGKGRHRCRSAFHYPGVWDGELIDFFRFCTPCVFVCTLHRFMHLMLPLLATKRLMDGMETQKGDGLPISLMNSCFMAFASFLCSKHLRSVNMALCPLPFTSDKSSEQAISGSSSGNVTSHLPF